MAICVSLEVPAGIFVPSFVIGACGGRIIGEVMAIWFPDGLRGPNGPQIFPGLYAVVGMFDWFMIDRSIISVHYFPIIYVYCLGNEFLFLKF